MIKLLRFTSNTNANIQYSYLLFRMSLYYKARGLK